MIYQDSYIKLDIDDKFYLSSGQEDYVNYIFATFLNSKVTKVEISLKTITDTTLWSNSIGSITDGVGTIVLPESRLSIIDNSKGLACKLEVLVYNSTATLSTFNISNINVFPNPKYHSPTLEGFDLIDSTGFYDDNGMYLQGRDVAISLKSVTTYQNAEIGYLKIRYNDGENDRYEELPAISNINLSLLAIHQDMYITLVDSRGAESNEVYKSFLTTHLITPSIINLRSNRTDISGNLLASGIRAKISGYYNVPSQSKMNYTITIEDSILIQNQTPVYEVIQTIQIAYDGTGTGNMASIPFNTDIHPLSNNTRYTQYSIADKYILRVTIRNALGDSSSSIIELPFANVPFTINKSGIGIGKHISNGVLDVSGTSYFNDGDINIGNNSKQPISLNIGKDTFFNTHRNSIVDFGGIVKFGTDYKLEMLSEGILAGECMLDIRLPENTSLQNMGHTIMGNMLLLGNDINVDSGYGRFVSGSIQANGNIDAPNINVDKQVNIGTTGRIFVDTNVHYYHKDALSGVRAGKEAVDIAVGGNVKLTATANSIKTPYVIYSGSNVKIDGASTSARYYRQDADTGMRVDANSVSILFKGTAKHIFYSTGTKSGGTMEIDGVNYGMSPVDSPKTLIEDVYTDYPIEEGSQKIYLDEIYSKMIDKYALSFTSPQYIVSITKYSDHFEVVSERDFHTDIFIKGLRKGESTAFKVIKNIEKTTIDEDGNEVQLDEVSAEPTLNITTLETIKDREEKII